MFESRSGTGRFIADSWFSDQPLPDAYTCREAEAVRAAADPALLDAADLELGDFHRAMVAQALQREMRGGGGAVVAGARRATPYLLRQARWRPD